MKNYFHSPSSVDVKPTTRAFEIPQRLLAVPITPETIRLPRAGERCPYSGLSRSALNALVLPTAANGYRPPVRSSVLRQRGATTGIRLIFYQSLIDYIHAHEDTGQGEEVPETKGGEV